MTGYSGVDEEGTDLCEGCRAPISYGRFCGPLCDDGTGRDEETEEAS